jgi:hypothetical protein
MLYLWLEIYKINCEFYVFCYFKYNSSFKTTPARFQSVHHNHRSLIEEFYQQDEEIKSNSKCNLVNLNEWDPKIKNLFRNVPRYSSCMKHEPLTYIKSDVLYINQAINRTFYKGLISKCELAPVMRNTALNDNYQLGKYVKIVDQFIELDLNYDVFKVRCFGHDSELIRNYKYVKTKTGSRKKVITDNYVYVNKSLLVYEYVHFNMRKLNETEYKYDNQKLNVMIFIIDGVSLSSFKRALPNTLSYLSTFNEFFLFEKHHVTGENTFQNLMPLLSNLNYTEVNKYQNLMRNFTMYPNKTKTKIEPPFDKVPFIWNEFKKKLFLINLNFLIDSWIRFYF